MPLTLSEIEKIAALSRIELTETEKGSLLVELSAILDYFKKLQELDTRGVNLDLTETELTNTMREDLESESRAQDKILANAPLKEDKFIRVKAVLK